MQNGGDGKRDRRLMGRDEEAGGGVLVE